MTVVHMKAQETAADRLSAKFDEAFESWRNDEQLRGRFEDAVFELTMDLLQHMGLDCDVLEEEMVCADAAFDVTMTCLDALPQIVWTRIEELATARIGNGETVQVWDYLIERQENTDE